MLMLLRPASDQTPATTIQGAFAGLNAACAYAALEILLNGPFTLRTGEEIGPQYAGLVFLYVALYAVLGALAGAVVGFVLGRLGLRRHHLPPSMSAVLALAFVGNALCWGSTLGSSPFLGMLLPLALWLLCGLLFAAEDKARSVAGSPWPAAILTLAPLSLCWDLMDGSPAPQMPDCIELVLNGP